MRGKVILKLVNGETITLENINGFDVDKIAEVIRGNGTFTTPTSVISARHVIRAEVKE